MIDLSKARDALLRAEELFDQLDGYDIDDLDAVASQGKSKIREEKAQASKDLLLLVDQFEMVAHLVKNAYWTFKGEEDYLEPRDDEESS